jgi:hypothetical protein
VGSLEGDPFPRLLLVLQGFLLAAYATLCVPLLPQEFNASAQASS